MPPFVLVKKCPVSVRHLRRIIAVARVADWTGRTSTAAATGIDTGARASPRLGFMVFAHPTRSAARLAFRRHTSSFPLFQTLMRWQAVWGSSDFRAAVTYYVGRTFGPGHGSCGNRRPAWCGNLVGVAAAIADCACLVSATREAHNLGRDSRKEVECAQRYSRSYYCWHLPCRSRPNLLTAMRSLLLVVSTAAGKLPCLTG
jgi:hypothetical protein